MTPDTQAPNKPLRVLIVEDSEDDTILLMRELRRGGYDPIYERVETPRAMEKALEKQTWDIVISDYVLPKFSGYSALDTLKAAGLDLPFIIVSGNIGEDVAVEAMKAGAHDYIMKDRLKRLVPAIERELREAAVRRDRRIAHDNLNRATDLLEKIFSLTHIMIAYIDKDFNFVRVNPAFAEAHKRMPDAFPGKNYFALFPNKEEEAIFRRVVETGTPSFLSAAPLETARIPGQETMYVSRSLQPVRELDGGVSGVILMMLDVTREVTIEAHARQSQKMEALGVLAGGIAHDFNNLLAAIVVNSEMALLDADKPEGVKHYLPSVLEAAARGKGLVKQVLTFSRQGEQELKPTKLSPVVQEALKFLRASLPSTIEIRARLSAKDDVALADVTQIYQILLNLGNNAAHAMRERGGVLEVSLTSIDIDDRTAECHPDLKPGPCVKLTVSDTGTGIAPDVLPRIFDPFFTTKKAGEGTGMGLAVVHGIVKKCGGVITVGSEVGKGTTFNLFFPRLADDVKRGKPSSGPIPSGGERILLVDDEELQAQSVHDMLERLGYDVTFETDSVRALALLRSRPESFDLVITDQTMPHMSGVKLAEAAMEIRPGIPVILCTGFSDVVGEDSAKSLGIREFVMKPFTVREIAAVIRKALDARA